LFDKKAKIYLHIGLEKFARADNLEADFLVNFHYDGDDEIRTKVFDDESFRMHYHNDLGDDNDDGREEGEGQQNL
jgi:hypothetical protein